nr:immunoglobulin heavy chain junction region [Mus musculus]MBK4183910.1 immunoglobulin heavy chain junction region [Mus musculus]
CAKDSNYWYFDVW